MTSFGTVVSYPIPPYSNVAIESDFYQPGQFFISAIVLGLTTLVTTTTDMNYVVGQEIRLIIPPEFGCRELNGQTGFVLSIPASNQVIVSIDSSRNVNEFTSSSATTQPQIIAIGDVNSGALNAFGRLMTGTFVPGSFINISPN